MIEVIIFNRVRLQVLFKYLEGFIKYLEGFSNYLKTVDKVKITEGLGPL